jgi:polysaccharide export outer membrane protein
MKEPCRNRSRQWGMGGAIYAVLLVLGGCAIQEAKVPAPSPAPGVSAAATPYEIGAGDTLEVIVWNEEKLSGPVQVRPDGMITVALIGDVAAAGTAPEKLAESIRAGLSRFVDDPNVVVRVAATGSRRYFIVGNVKTPGAYDLRAGQTFLQALSVAGGFTDFAKRSAVHVIRQNGTAAPVLVDYDAVVRGDAPDVRLEASDTIVVP